MDKMFYSLEEAAAKLGKGVEAVRDMAARGQLQEFRDRDRLVFRKEQVDLLAGGDDDIIKLADSGELEPLTMQASGSAIQMSPASDGTGIGIYDLDATDDSDPSAVTRVSASPSSLVDPGDKSASGSGGLLDLTREADDTSLGQNLLEDVYGSETMAQQTASAETGISEGGALFESPVGGDIAEPAMMPAMVMAEPYDGPGSGLVGGLSIGVIVAVGIAAFTIIMSMTSTAGGGLVSTIGNSFMILIGVMVAVPIIGAILGFVLGKRN